MQWISQHSDLLFGGLGTAIVVGIVGWLLKRFIFRATKPVQAVNTAISSPTQTVNLHFISPAVQTNTVNQSEPIIKTAEKQPTIDTRRLPINSAIGLTTLDVYFDRSTNPKVNFKSKLRIVLKNDSGKEMRIRVPRWISEAGDVSIQWPPTSTLQFQVTPDGKTIAQAAETRYVNDVLVKTFASGNKV